MRAVRSRHEPASSARRFATLVQANAKSTRPRIASPVRSPAPMCAGLSADGGLEVPAPGGRDRPGHRCGTSGYCAGLEPSTGAPAGAGAVPLSWSGFMPAPQTCLPSASVLQPCFSLFGSAAGASAAGLLPPHPVTPAVRPASASATNCFVSFNVFLLRVACKRRSLALIQDPFRTARSAICTYVAHAAST